MRSYIAPARIRKFGFKTWVSGHNSDNTGCHCKLLFSKNSFVSSTRDFCSSSNIYIIPWQYLTHVHSFDLFRDKIIKLLKYMAFVYFCVCAPIFHPITWPGSVPISFTFSYSLLLRALASDRPGSQERNQQYIYKLSPNRASPKSTKKCQE